MPKEIDLASAESEGSPHRVVRDKNPMVFISHDSRDAELAEAFSRLLGSVSAGVLKSFRSSDKKGTQGIEYGVEWYPELMKRLESASDVVCLLTKRSLDRPWILYEAGVAKGKLDTPVYGIAFGISLGKANSGPFAQFQNSDDDEEALTKLVMQLLHRIPGSEPDRDAVQMQVRSFKETAAKALQKVKGPKGELESESLDVGSVAKLFEEVKIMFQDLPSRVEGRLLEERSPYRRRTLKRIHPMMLHEMTDRVTGDPRDPIGLLLVAGTVREDLPWLAELLLETYRMLRAGDRTALPRLRRALRVLRKSRVAEQLSLVSEESHMLLMEMPMLVDRLTQSLEVELFPEPDSEVNEVSES